LPIFEDEYPTCALSGKGQLDACKVSARQPLLPHLYAFDETPVLHVDAAAHGLLNQLAL